VPLHLHIWMNWMDIEYLGLRMFAAVPLVAIFAFLLFGGEWVIPAGIGTLALAAICSLSYFLIWFKGKPKSISLAEATDFADKHYGGLPVVKDQELALMATGLGSVAFIYKPVQKGKYKVSDRSVFQREIRYQTGQEPQVSARLYAETIAEER